MATDASDLNLHEDLQISSARGFLLQGDLDETHVHRIAEALLTEPVVEQASVSCLADASQDPAAIDGTVVFVLPKPGVTDSEAETALRELQALGYPVTALRTCRKYCLSGLTPDQVNQVAQRLLGNRAIEQFIFDRLQVESLDHQECVEFNLVTVPICDADDSRLQAVSKQRSLSLTLTEMQTVRDHFVRQQREPTDVELDTIAQTWSEHCSHKTLAGRIEYSDDQGSRKFDNMLRETIFAATVSIREALGSDDWCVSVFKDNAGVVDFEGDSCLTFKVETHNRPSAIEPYGGANTGIGGVIRDTLGTGMGARPVCNTDVFCFAPPDTPADELPNGVLHPRRIMKSVVAGVRDYGNRMGIPTVNGAVYFDSRYVGNPLVFCGNVGLIPRDRVSKQPRAGDLIVSIGGRTGRDGIHGATFSSAELTEKSGDTSAGAVQIGNAITEKMVADVLLEARDRGLYTAVTDCGAGGFSSAVGEMGEELGAEVWLERAPLKYQGLSYREIWISEAQERMVLAVPESNWEELEALCQSESVEATVIGKFMDTGQLHLTMNRQTVGRLDMEFLHDGRPPVIRQANWQPPEPVALPAGVAETVDHRDVLLRILASGNVASKHWIIRQYDHEVLGGSVVKPLVGICNDGPSDAAVLRPQLDSRRGIAVACGMNPWYGDLDPWHMAASGIDEAVRNCVAVGADPARIAILDNFCWGSTDQPETLGSLVRAALACQELAVQLGTPFISGKDSLNNEISIERADGSSQTIAIPGTLLISALGQVPDVERCVTMDLKTPGNLLFLIGHNRGELGGSHFNLVNRLQGDCVPTVDGLLASQTFAAVFQAISSGLVRSCHDLSEGGLAVAAAEMAFAGGCGAQIHLDRISLFQSESGESGRWIQIRKLFGESNTRFLCEVPPRHAAAFRDCLADLPLVELGQVTDDNRLRCVDQADDVLVAAIDELKSAWQKPFDWN